MEQKPLVVITGASSGIGKSLAKKFSEAGYPLLLLARQVEKIKALGLPNVICESVDVQDASQFKTAVDKAVNQFGAVDCLINNAGLMLLGDPMVQDPAEWQRTMNTNVIGVYNGIHSVLASMVSRQHGTVINIGSITGRKPFSFHAAYCASKFAVHALSESIRADVAKYNVRVSIIAPGVVETELLSHTSSDEIKHHYKEWQSTLNYVLKPEDIAETAFYIYSRPQEICIREMVVAATAQET